MDISELIAKLQLEKREIEQAISTLERLAIVRLPKQDTRKVRCVKPAPKNGKPGLPDPPSRTCRS